MESELRSVEILLVEDNPGDVRLTQEAFANARVVNTLYVVKDGEAAIKFLRAESPHENAVRPDLVLLDLNMPRMDGREVLAEVEGDPALRLIPIVVLTTSEAEQDVLRSYELHANCCIRKPVDFEKFIEVIKSIEGFWFDVVKLPRFA